jgi:hypothetical protein
MATTTYLVQICSSFAADIHVVRDWVFFLSQSCEVGAVVSDHTQEDLAKFGCMVEMRVGKF